MYKIQQKISFFERQEREASPEVETPFRIYTLTKSCQKERFNRVGIFGFELISVNEPRTVEEVNWLEKSVRQWHENLLKTISNYCQEELEVNLKYFTERNHIKCHLIFTVFAVNDKELKQSLNTLQGDLSAFFSSTKFFNTCPYLFQEINNKECLKSSKERSCEFKYEEFFRSPIKIESRNSIGFNAIGGGDNSKTNESNSYHKLPPLPKDLSFDNELFRALLNQSEDTEINILVKPRNLKQEEIDLVRQVNSNNGLIDDKNFNEEELDSYKDYLRGFVDSNNNKFLIRVMLKHKSPTLSQHLKTGILNYFFGRRADADSRHQDTSEPFGIHRDGASNQLSYLYSIDNSIQAFRLPIPSFGGLPGVTQKPLNFHTTPDNLSDNGITLGVKKTGNTEQEIQISQQGLAKHFYVMGQTGTGKSTLLKTMINDCLKKDEGFTVIDPHGDLFDEVEKLIPEGKQDKLVIIDTTNPKDSATFNPLSFNKNKPEKKSLVINELIRIVGSLYDLKSVGGPMFELYMKNGLLLVLDEGVQKLHDSEPGLEHFNKTFYQKQYRKELLKKCYDSKIIDFFGNALKTTGDMSFENFTPYITSKLTRLTDDAYISPIISAGDGNINFREVIDEKKILMVKVDKGLIGADNVSLLGQMVISRMVMAAMSRVNINKENRTPYYLFIDEFQNFIRGDVGSALSEVRKYGLSLILANQTMGQLDSSIVQAIMGNVGSKCFFRPGVNDYAKIKHYVEPEFNRKDVLKLPNFNCISRLMIDNVPCDPFIFQTKMID